MVTINFHEQQVVVDGRVWSSSNLALARFLNNVSIQDIATSDPFPDMTIARQIVKQFGARVVSLTEPIFDKGRVY